MADRADKSAPRLKPCPICGKPAVVEMRPFCSARCKDIDLNRWLSGAYAIPAAEADEEDEPLVPPKESDLS
jgi:endogenous inhibitor of DNA gyrase (YacG/DUF329 family)